MKLKNEIIINSVRHVLVKNSSDTYSSCEICSLLYRCKTKRFNFCDYIMGTQNYHFKIKRKRKRKIIRLPKQYRRGYTLD